MTPQVTTSDKQNLLSVSQAQQQILDLVKAITETETINLEQALNRVLATDITSKVDLPGFDNSAMDGYALASQALEKLEIAENNKISLQVVGESFAGKPYSGPAIQATECVRIMTGAMLPPGCDLVVMQEQAIRDENSITINAAHKAGENIRRQAEDVQAGSVILTTGKQLSAADIGLLAATGHAQLLVYRKPKVAFFSTGDELSSLDKPLQAGQIYDSNRYMLQAMIKHMGMQAIDLGVIPDNKQAIKSALQTAAEQADAIITSGGVSVGEADFVKQVLDEIGAVHFWRVAMKPGKPLAIGTIANCFFFGLPGNPVSVFATFYQFAQAALLKIMGTQARSAVTFQARSLSDLHKKPGRAEFQRGIMRRNDNGELEVSTSGGQGSHVLSSLSQADCFIILSAENAGVRAGELVEIQPLYGLI